MWPMTIVESRPPEAPGVLVLTLRGRLDAASADAFVDHLTGAMDKGERAFVLNLAGLEYVNSIGLRSLVGASKKLAAQHGRIVLCGPPHNVQHVFETVGFNSLFHVVATEQAALAWIGQGGPDMKQ